MISTDFAPNEEWRDGLLALRLVFQPWKWQKGKELDLTKKYLERKYFPKHSVSLFLSARSALYFLLKTLQLPKNAEIIVQAFTCEAVILPILANQLIPVYVDINENNFSMDVADLEKKITPQSQVIILQHTFGLTPDRAAILAIAKKHNLLVVEDLAHGFDPQLYKNDRQKTIKLLSFGRSKAFSSVFGGALVIKDAHLAQKIKKINLLSPSSLLIFRLYLYKIFAPLIKSTYDLYLGKIIHLLANLLNLWMPEVSQKEKQGKFDTLTTKAYPNGLATLILAQLKRQNQITKMRKKVIQLYLHKLPPALYPAHLTGLNDYLLRFPALVNQRSELLQKLNKQKIFLGKWYNQPVAPYGISLSKMRYQPGSCPKAEEMTSKIINLPTNITIKNANQIIKLLTSNL